MAQRWEEPQVQDVKAFMASVVIDRATENDNVQKILSITIKRVRGIIGRANTLSDNESEVPPEGLEHTLILTIGSLLVATPNFNFLMKGPDGETGFGFKLRQAEKWLEDVRNGMSVTYPTNPQSEYPELVRHGSDDDEVDTTAS